MDEWGQSLQAIRANEIMREYGTYIEHSSCLSIDPLIKDVEVSVKG
jgi:hypothetical protein